MTRVTVAARFRKRIGISASTVVFTSAFQLGCPIMVGKVVYRIFPTHASVYPPDRVGTDCILNECAAAFNTWVIL